MQTLYDRPDLYDVIAPHDPTLEAFYLSRARERGGRVLDLACGSGRLSIPLARAGFKVTAADLSGAMLQRARQAAAGVEVEFAELDMRDFDLPGRTFETIIVAMNSILHVQSLEDFRGFFQSVARHLAPCGRLAFDAFVPSVALLGSSPEQRHPVGDGVHEALGRVSVDETIRYDPLTQINHVDWYWSTAAEKDFWRTPMQMRQIFPQEMPLLIASGGMRLVERFGDFDLRPFAEGSYRQVCVCAAA